VRCHPSQQQKHTNLQFPIANVSFTLKDGTNLDLAPKEVADALQYSDTPGMPPFVAVLREMQNIEHGVKSPSGKLPYPVEEMGIAVTTGSQDALTKLFEMLLNPGDPLLVENPTYSGVLSFLKPFGAKLVGVDVDDEGLIPSKLRQVLESYKGREQERPKVLYTIPTGQNPSGASTSAARKKEIYQLACEFNFIIIEDDPYWYLRYGQSPVQGTTPDDEKALAAFNPPSDIPTYLSLDTNKRVLRVDSFSKVLSSGLRVGFVTGPKEFVDQLNLTSQVTNLHSSGLPQAILTRLLKHWGQEGWESHVKRTKLFYAQRRDYFLSKVKEHLHGLVDYTIPDAGMFVWFRIKGLGTNSRDLIQKKAVDAKVLMLPGEAFLVNEPTENVMYVRACFSTASDYEIDEALRRFGCLLQELYMQHK